MHTHFASPSACILPSLEQAVHYGSLVKGMQPNLAFTGDKIMANKSLFQSIRGRLASKTNARNEAGGQAYAFSDEQALAQYASTGCLNGTFYASADMQLDVVLKLCDKVAPEFIARTALFARQRGFMKDLPAL